MQLPGLSEQFSNGPKPILDKLFRTGFAAEYYVSKSRKGVIFKACRRLRTAGLKPVTSVLRLIKLILGEAPVYLVKVIN